jgi:arabinogalactan oligomer/maltooligosaccharide transport system permease protein
MNSITILITFLIIVLILTHQSIVVEYARKRGYDNFWTGLAGLIPVVGFIIYKRLPKRRNTSALGMKQIFTVKSILSRVFISAEISLVTIIVLVPVIYIFGTAFSGVKTSVPNTIWPENPTLDSFKYLLDAEQSDFKIWYGNTLLIAVINMVVGTVVITGAAFVFARFKFKGKKGGLLTILVLQSFPSFMGLFAMYVLFWKFGLLGRPAYLSILYIGGSIPGNLWLIKGFMGQIPRDLDESAMIDGASKFQIFTKIILPLSIPILTFVSVSMFMGPWMDYMLPSYLLTIPRTGSSGVDTSTQWTIAVGIYKFINDATYLNYSAFAAAAILIGAPITALYMAFQKYLIEGIMAGATKG